MNQKNENENLAHLNNFIKRKDSQFEFRDIEQDLNNLGDQVNGIFKKDGGNDETRIMNY